MSLTTSDTHGLQNGGVTVPTTIITTPAVTANVDSNTNTETAKNSVLPPFVVNESTKIAINNQPSVQICTEDNKKIIISGAKSVQDIPVNVLQHILNNVKNVKPNEAVLVINHTKNNAQTTEKKSYESIVKDALQVDLEPESARDGGVTENRTDTIPVDPLQNDPVLIPQQKQTECTTTNKSDTGNNDTKIKIYGLEENVDKNDKDKLSNVQLTAKSVSTAPVVHQPKSAVKQKKFLYRLKSKNGRILSYVSETPIVLKKPVICVDKMTQADAERLSKQFAEEKKRSTKRTTRLLNSSVNRNRNASDENLTPQQSYGVQTRKRKLKFLPDGRVVKDRKSKKLGSSCSSLSSLDDDDDLDKPVVTSDEDYNENLDDAPMMSSDEEVKIVSVKPASVKKVTSPKKIAAEKSRLYDSKADIRNNSNALIEKLNSSKAVTLSVNPQPSKPAPEKPNSNKSNVEPATVFTSLLKIPIFSSQLTERRFKPKSQIPRGSANHSFDYKRILCTDGKNRQTSLLKNNSSVSISLVAPKTVNNVTGVKSSSVPSRGVWSAKTASPKSEYRATSIDPPPLAPISQKITSTPKSFKQNTFNKTTANHGQNQPTLEVLSKFDGFTNTKIVKTKAGPKKVILDALKKSEEPRTIYEMMEEIFDSMPHWNIHVIPENKSFCLAQVSLGRNGVPTMKKSIEINSEFMAKVYVHQLHCKRFDGIYDTESKIKKLIHDIDVLAS